MMNIAIRKERVEDYQTTEQLVKRAFADMKISDHTEHELVARIRKDSEAFVPELSLVATLSDHEIVGHVLLSKIKIKGENQSTESLALAPVSVLPEYQSKGIGKRMILRALEVAKELGYGSVVVLGHPGYYPKFGFQKASVWGIKAPFDVPDEVFMAMELCEKALDGASGVVAYSRAFLE